MPRSAIKEAWLPRSIIRPWSITIITSELTIVDRRWAITKLVRFSVSLSMARWMSSSVRVSTELVASSRMSMGAFWSMARAMVSSCFCPAEMLVASERTVSNMTIRCRTCTEKCDSNQLDTELIDTLDVWDERLILFGTEVVQERAAFCKDLEPRAAEIYRGIAKNREEITLSYAPFGGAETKTEIAERFSEALKNARNADARAGFTSVGPHRDDLTLTIDGLSARTFGSQGQQRSIVLALKLAEADILYRKTGERPVILLDDVMSELDMSRRDYLLNHLDGRQVFITCCDPETVRLMETGRGFYVEKGTVRQDTDEKAGEVHAENETPTCESE